MGYLPEEVFGYAPARFTVERGEDKPEWLRHLSTNVRAYFKRSRAWLAKEHAANSQPNSAQLGLPFSLDRK
jgi:hypothetical protein